jgi:hypothetical protein
MFFYFIFAAFKIKKNTLPDIVARHNLFLLPREILPESFTTILKYYFTLLLKALG